MCSWSPWKGDGTKVTAKQPGASHLPRHSFLKAEPHADPGMQILKASGSSLAPESGVCGASLVWEGHSDLCREENPGPLDGSVHSWSTLQTSPFSPHVEDSGGKSPGKSCWCLKPSCGRAGSKGTNWEH